MTTVEQANLISKISLERPPSVRAHSLLSAEPAWMIPNYVVGPENESLRFLFDDSNVSALQSLSPIVFYGDRQVGKTALAVTLAVRWSRLTKLRPLCFTTGRAFAADFSAAVEIDDLVSFRQRHRECQLLVIDDLEQIEKAAASQQELLATLDAMAESGHPVIVSANRLPSTLRSLHPALTSRLSAGFSILLQKPSPASIKAIVSDAVTIVDSKLPVDDLVAFCLRLDTIPLSVPNLLKIVKLAAQNLSASGSIDWSVLKALSLQLMSGQGPSLPRIAKIVARKLQVKLVDMRASTRQANIVRARGLAILLARKLTSDSLQQIGEFFGGRDHSTVIHACRKTEKLIESDTELASLFQEVLAELLQAE